MASDAQVLRLASGLLSATRARKAVWTKTDAQRVTYSGGAGGVAIYPRDYDERWPYVLEILDSRGEVMETFLTGVTADVEGESVATPASVAVAELYGLARDSGVLSIVDGLLSEFEDEEPF